MSRNNAQVLTAAESIFAKKAKQVAEAQSAMKEYLDAQKRIEERTRKLRELRLARGRSEGVPGPPLKTASPN